MTVPNLAGVISKDDVFRKGTGSYAADYVSWARIANHLHTKAPGWEFALREAPEGGHVWKAPDGSGYVVSYFIGPDRQFTPDFLFPCQDHRNAPVPFEKVSCRVLTDTHRRALCANAAFTFSLGYELWAREEVEAATDEKPAAKAAAKPSTSKREAPKAKAEPAVTTTPSSVAADAPIDPEARQVVIGLLMEKSKAKGGTDLIKKLSQDFLAHFKLTGKLSGHITTEAHAEFIDQWFKSHQSN